MRIVMLLASSLSFAVLSPGLDSPAFAEDKHSTPTTRVPRERFLLLDSTIIEKTERAKLTLGVVRKDENNPLFGEDKPWEKRSDNVYPNVVYDEDAKLYKCWYSPFIVDLSSKNLTREQRTQTKYKPPQNREMAICYAESKDGIRWEKPELGLVEFDGSKKNNILWRGPHGVGIFRDTHDSDPTRRYKAFYQGVNVSFSADGIHWGKPIRCPEIQVVGDTHNNAFWAPTLGKYVGITRTWGPGRIREVARTESPDFLVWTKAEVVLKGLEKNLQTYSMPVFYHGGVYLGLVAIHDQKTDRVWTELAWSADTIEWNRVCPGTPFLANSNTESEYDWGCIYAGAYPVFLPNEVRIYYGASDGLHTGWRNSFFCLAHLRPDGFAGYEPQSRQEPKPATIVTKPIRVVSGSLNLTADVGESGQVQVSIVNKDGDKLAESQIMTKSGTDAAVEWTNGFSLANHIGWDVQLQFELRGAKMYSFSFPAIGKK